LTTSASPGSGPLPSPAASEGSTPAESPATPPTPHTQRLRTVLALETSCDETAAAVLLDGREVLASVVATQVEMHRAYGGVVPELAFRKHLEWVNPVVEQALEQAGLGWADIDAVAVSHGPGLVGALLIGVSTAKVIAGLIGRPLRGVNHLEAHVYANFLQHHDLEFPLLCLLVSGGHTQLISMQDHGRYRLLGETRDDAAGEAFDKVARCLGLGYPGGPRIDLLGSQGNSQAVAFPRSWIGPGSLEFSFSGLKTAVVNYTQRNGIPKPAAACAAGETSLEDVCASFQEAVVDVLTTKTMHAAAESGVRTVLMAGGVACNQRLQAAMQDACSQRGLRLAYPRPGLCTDNALMVACAGYHQLRAGLSSSLDLDCFPSLPVGGAWC
jgi:N6-L-threonylcarbamoyladenine synthase